MSDIMKLIIISGQSGSGKTICLHTLEDLGYYCVDSLPVDMLPILINKIANEHTSVAISIDARNLPTEIEQLAEIIQNLKNEIDYLKIIYLDANDYNLLCRFSETRRRHPLTSQNKSLPEAIKLEQKLLQPLAAMADLKIDTTHLSTHELSKLIRNRVAVKNDDALQLVIQSFAFKNGIPLDIDINFDVRCLPNPYWDPSLRFLTGLDDKVAQFLSKQSEVQLMISDIMRFLETWIPRFKKDNRSYLTVGIGCTGGQHRSVFIAHKLVNHIKAHQLDTQVIHRDLPTKL